MCQQTRLTDEKADVVAEDWCTSVQKVTRQLDHNGQLGEFLN